ncbi:hypothetical protein CRYUN_Cryun02cG0113900 [Craigia yunnanensis]
MENKSIIVVSFILLPLLLTTISAQKTQLRPDFYRTTCPNVEFIVRSAVQKKFQQTFVTASGTLRLFFHDCFVRGCDASVLLVSANGNAENDHPDDVSLAGDGFDTVIKAKAVVDSIPQCRNKVSCADILALATREVIRLLRQMCPRNVDPRIAINMDPTTPRTFDNVYYKNLQQGMGLFTSDQILFRDPRSINTVNPFASSNAAFQKAFVAAITKLGRVGVLTGNQVKFDEIALDQTKETDFFLLDFLYFFFLHFKIMFCHVIGESVCALDLNSYGPGVLTK